jgi:hypothetical protein
MGHKGSSELPAPGERLAAADTIVSSAMIPSAMFRCRRSATDPTSPDWWRALSNCSA